MQVNTAISAVTIIISSSSAHASEIKSTPTQLTGCHPKSNEHKLNQLGATRNYTLTLNEPTGCYPQLNQHHNLTNWVCPKIKLAPTKVIEYNLKLNKHDLNYEKLGAPQNLIIRSTN